jgi:hypothetical protein
VSEIKQRAADAMFGNPHALDAERPGRNRFFDPGYEEIFFSQLQICRVDDLRTASFRPALTLGDFRDCAHRCSDRPHRGASSAFPMMAGRLNGLP